MINAHCLKNWWVKGREQSITEDVGTVPQGTRRHGSTHLCCPYTQEAASRGSLVTSHPGLATLAPCLAIFIFTSTQLFLGSFLETMETSIAVIDLKRIFFSGMKKRAGWDRVLCGLGCPWCCIVAEEDLEQQILLTGMSYQPQTVVWNTTPYRKKARFVESHWSQVHRRKQLQHGRPCCRIQQRKEIDSVNLQGMAKENWSWTSIKWHS